MLVRTGRMFHSRRTHAIPCGQEGERGDLPLLLREGPPLGSDRPGAGPDAPHRGEGGPALSRELRGVVRGMQQEGSPCGAALDPTATRSPQPQRARGHTQNAKENARGQPSPIWLDPSSQMLRPSDLTLHRGVLSQTTTSGPPTGTLVPPSNSIHCGHWSEETGGAWALLTAKKIASRG